MKHNRRTPRGNKKKSPPSGRKTVWEWILANKMLSALTLIVGLLVSFLELGSYFQGLRISATEPTAASATEPTAEAATEENDYPGNESFTWISRGEAQAIYGQNDAVSLCIPPEETDYYTYGVFLSVLYNNLAPHDRVLSEFTVKATNIQENYDSFLSGWQADKSDIIDIFVKNSGWGDSGPITVRVNRIQLEPTSTAPDGVSLSVRPDAPDCWIGDSVAPGETGVIDTLHISDFVVEGQELITKTICYGVFLEVTPENGKSIEVPTAIAVSKDEIVAIYYGMGDAPTKHHVVLVDTSQPVWERTYHIEQVLPANSCIRFPICIAPVMSCTMDISMEFKTLDGEVLRPEPLSARFTVPYYEDLYNYVDGDLKKWLGEPENGQVVYFPFNTTPLIVDPADYPEHSF